MKNLTKKTHKTIILKARSGNISKNITLEIELYLMELKNSNFMAY